MRCVLIVPFVLQIVGTVGLVSYLSFKNGQQAVNDLVNQLMSDVSDRTQQHLKSYTKLPQQITRLVTDDLELGTISLKAPNLRSLDAYFLKRIQTFDGVSFIYVGNEQGKFIGAGPTQRFGQLDHIVEVADGTTKGNYLSYAVDARGDRIKQVGISKNYDPRRRPWYKAAAKGKATWSEIYAFIGEANEGLTITAVKPFYQASGRLAGVAAVDLYLNDISVFLNRLHVSHSGRVFVMEPDGNLVASSDHQRSYTKAGGRLQRLTASASSDPLIRATVEHLQHAIGNFGSIQKPQRLQFENRGQRAYVQVSPWRDEFGLNWLIVAVMPESDFMARIDANTRTTVWLCLAALIVSIAIGAVTARRITRPILRLNATAKAIAAGQWQPPITLDRADELGELTHSFNQMASQLQASLAEMQQLNQKLSDGESRLAQFLEALPIGVAVHNPDGTVFYFNQTAKRLLGIETIPDRTIERQAAAYQIYRVGTQQLYPVEDLPAVRALRGENVVTDDLELHRDGDIHFLEVLATPIVDGLGKVTYAIVAFQDVSERKHAEATLRASEARFRRLTENVPGVIYRYVYYANGTRGFTYLSPRFRELYETDQALAMDDPNCLWRMVPPEDLAAMRTSIDLCTQQLQPWSMEHRVLLPSGRLIWVQHFSCPERQPNGDVIYDGFSINVTDRKQAELFLANYNRLLEQQVQERTLALEQEIAERQKAEDALKQVNLELKRLATLDGLTQIANRHRFDTYFTQEWRRAVREQTPLSLILCDVDFFKPYNDRYGHQAGDECLRQIAQAMSSAIKRPSDLLARYGGEEFVVVLPNTDSEGANTVAAALQAEIRRLKLSHAHSKVSDYITISLGIASTIPQVDGTLNNLVAAADTALYRAKKEGRDRTVTYQL